MHTNAIQLNRFFLLLLTFLTACTPIQTPPSHQYQLTAFSTAQHRMKPQLPSLFIAMPDATAGYQSEQMLYLQTPYELNAFAHHTWTSTPAMMLYPLLLQSLQHSHAFFAVTGGVNVDKTDYRLETQLLALQQNFICKPSRLEWKIQVVLTHVDDQRVVASRLFEGATPCSSDTPYGGARAANEAMLQFTQALTRFTIQAVRRDLV